MNNLEQKAKETDREVIYNKDQIPCGIVFDIGRFGR